MTDQPTPSPAEGEPTTTTVGSAAAPIVVNVPAPANSSRSALSWVLGTVAVVVLVGMSFVAGLAVARHHDGKAGHGSRDAVEQMRDRRQAGQDRQAAADKIRDWLRERRDEMGRPLRGGQDSPAQGGQGTGGPAQGSTGEPSGSSLTSPTRP